MHELAPEAARSPIATAGATLLTEPEPDERHPPGFEIKKGGLGSAGQAVALATLCAVLFLTFLDNTIVSVGLANVQSDLHAGVTSLQWVVNGYALTFASFMLAAGMLGDILGRKRIMLAGVAIFCAGSVVAALASNVDWLIAGRVIMGVGRRRQRAGHALHHPARLPRPGDPGRRARGVGGRLGPGARPRAGHRRRAGRVLELAGHLLVQPRLRRWWPSSWRRSSCPRPRTARDAASTCSGSSSVPRSWPAMSFAVIQGEESGYTASWIVTLFVLCGLSGVAFVVDERRVKSPMLDLTHVPPAPVRRFQLRRLRRLLRHLLHLLLHRPVPPGRRRTRRPTRRRSTSSPWPPG